MARQVWKCQLYSPPPPPSHQLTNRGYFQVCVRPVWGGGGGWPWALSPPPPRPPPLEMTCPICWTLLYVQCGVLQPGSGISWMDVDLSWQIKGIPERLLKNHCPGEQADLCLRTIVHIPFDFIGCTWVLFWFSGYWVSYCMVLEDAETVTVVSAETTHSVLCSGSNKATRSRFQ